MKIRLSNSNNHFLDTNVLLRHANSDSGEYASDINTILSEACGPSPKRKLWVSAVLFAELRPSSLKQGGNFGTVEKLAEYIRGIASVVTPDPETMLMAARLRDLKWSRSPDKMNKGELHRCMTLGDALHIASALWVQNLDGVSDLEFLTFDDSSDHSFETDPGTKSLPLLSLEDYLHGAGNSPDAIAAARLSRLKPMLRQKPLDL